MEFNNLKIFKVVAETGTISKAAAVLHYVQSNVTARIQRLEEELGVQLFVRSRQGMTLTVAGEVLLDYARRALQLAEEARMAVSSTKGVTGTLRLGSLETILAIRLSEILSTFHRQYKTVEIKIITGSTDHLIDALLGYRIDGAFVAGQISHPAIDSRTVFIEEVVLVSPPQMTDIHN